MYINPIFAALPDAERQTLVRKSSRIEYKRGELVRDYNVTTPLVYVVASGLLRVCSLTSDEKSITTGFLQRQDVYVAQGLASDFTSESALIAALPSSVYSVPADYMRLLCARYPQLSMELLDSTLRQSAGVRKAFRKVMSSSTESIIANILHELQRLAPSASGGVDKRITQALIASYSGLSREQVNKTMRDLEARGLVKKDEHGMQVSESFGNTDFGSFDVPAPAPPPAEPPMLPDGFLDNLEPPSRRYRR